MQLLVKEQLEQLRNKQNFKVKYCKLILYQCVFVLFLTLYFSAILWLYLQSLDTFHPRIRHRKSQPGLASRPITDNPYSTLIEFTSGYEGNWKPLKQSVRDFFKAYKHGIYPGTSVKCRWEAGIVTSDWCHVSRRKFENYWKNDVEVQCNKMENYGYTLGKPCIYLKPTKLFDWEPEPYYNVTEVEYLEFMPQWLKQKIRSTWEKKCQGKGEEKESQCPDLRMVWLSCEGDTPADTEYMGPLEMRPMPGFPGQYFPFQGQNHYLSPIVVIQLTDLTPGVLVSIKCKMWAKNIKHDPKDDFKGGLRFELRMN